MRTYVIERRDQPEGGGEFGNWRQAGIELEPDRQSDKLNKIVINNCIFEENSGSGLQVWLKKLTEASEDVTVLCVDSYFRDCPQHAVTIGCVGDNGPKGLIEFKNCAFERVGLTGVHIVDKSARRVKLKFTNCKWKDVARSKKFRRESWLVPFYFHLDNPEDISKLGNVEFSNCHIYDNKNRAFLFISDKGKGISHVKVDNYVQQLEDSTIRKYGLRRNEKIHICSKPLRKNPRVCSQ